MTRFASYWFGLAFTVWLPVAHPTLSAAEPDGANEASLTPQELARREFREGSRLAAAGDYAAALEHYRASFRFFPHATTLYNASYCLEELGDQAGALRDLYEAQRLGVEQPERALTPERFALAVETIRALRDRVAALTLVPLAADTSVLVDGHGLTSVPTETWWFVDGDAADRYEPLPATITVLLNPGTHRFEWQRLGTSFLQTVELKAGRTTALSWPTSTEPAPRSAPKPSVARLAVSRRTAAVVEDRKGSSHLGTTGRVLLVAGAGGVTAGLVFGGVALATKRELDRRCTPDGGCPPGQEMRIVRFRESVKYANQAFVLGMLAAAAGGTLVWIDSSRREMGSLRVGAGSVTLERRF